jgi:hypothetical protein
MSDLVSVTDIDEALNNLPEELRQRLLNARKAIEESATFSLKKIGVKQGGIAYRLPDESTSTRFSGIVLAVKHANKFYPNPYVATKIEPAKCVAVVESDGDVRNAELAPLNAVSDKPSDNCATCPNFQWGSNPQGTGKGKLCTEYVIAAVYVPALGDDIYLVEQKKARAAKFDTYLKRITAKAGHPMMVVTQFEINVNGEPFEQEFTAVSQTPAELIPTLAERIEEANQILVASVKNSLVTNDEGPLATTDEAGSSGRAPRKR